MSNSGGQSVSNRKIDGVMVGIVTNNNDPEGLGRGKLKLSIREVENETDWVRIATFFAGNGRGSYFIPEVGDEVLVAFHLGEVRQPYVIGMLWSRNNVPPAEDVMGFQQNNIRKFTSRAGHEIVFDDGVLHGKVKITTRRGQVIEMDDLLDKITITDMTGANSITIWGSAMQSITLRSGLSSIKLSSMGSVTITAPAGVQIKSGKVDISGGMVDVKSLGMLNLSAAGITTVKGSLVKIN